ncbi:hypothetical protein OKW38_001412 [Paraburkholderia sp. MM5496-R1]|uniref:hypothetical protein n=1 Tax=Paraburkholderia TaxID=1822464 RepID=UPI0014289C7B|nr:hypothetical protein [Paraburkholderia tuberum]
MHKLILVPGQHGCRPVNKRETALTGAATTQKQHGTGRPAIKPESIPSTETN